MHRTHGLTCTFEESEHLLFTKVCAIDRVRIDSVLEVTPLHTKFQTTVNVRNVYQIYLIQGQEKVHNLPVPIGILNNSRILFDYG